MTTAQAHHLVRLAYLTPAADRAVVRRARDMLYAEFDMQQIVEMWIKCVNSQTKNGK